MERTAPAVGARSGTGPMLLTTAELTVGGPASGSDISIRPGRR